MPKDTQSNNIKTRSDKNKAAKYLLSSTAPILEQSPTSPIIRGRSEMPSVAIQSIMTATDEKFVALESRLVQLETGQNNILLLLEEIKSFVSSNSTTETTATPTLHEDAVQHVKELNDHLLAEKRLAKLNQEADIVKRKFSLKWKNSLNKRNQCFANHFRNQEKANLYSEWLESSPEYLPLKFRPHVSPGERDDIRKVKISEAKIIYNNSVTTMRNSSDVNKAKFSSIDEEMLNTITSESTSPAVCEVLKSRWESDCENGSSRAKELWQTRRQFLSTKKDESVRDGTDTLTKTKQDGENEQNTRSNSGKRRTTPASKAGGRKHKNDQHSNVDQKVQPRIATSNPVKPNKIQSTAKNQNSSRNMYRNSEQSHQSNVRIPPSRTSDNSTFSNLVPPQSTQTLPTFSPPVYPHQVGNALQTPNNNFLWNLLNYPPTPPGPLNWYNRYPPVNMI